MLPPLTPMPLLDRDTTCGAAAARAEMPAEGIMPPVDSRVRHVDYIAGAAGDLFRLARA